MSRARPRSALVVAFATPLALVVTLVLAAPLAGCGGGALGRIGDPCSESSQCKAGKMPLCFTQTSDGYCTTTCDGDADCGADGKCVSFGSLGLQLCLHACSSASDCRSDYACFTFGGCLAAEGFDCDPTAGDGSCSTATVAHGACIRTALGDGMRGTCTDVCNIGSGTCTSSAGFPRQCIATDQTGAGSNDRWRGPACQTALTAPPPAQPLAECLIDAPNGAVHLDYGCTDGNECWLGGDQTCRALCYLPGGAPDPSIPMPPGGAGAGDCAAGTTCHDVWSLADAPVPSRRVGLCL